MKNELIPGEGDDEFNDIANNYMDRPVSETLMYFNEALKNLLQRRRQADDDKGKSKGGASRGKKVKRDKKSIDSQKANELPIESGEPRESSNLTAAIN